MRKLTQAKSDSSKTVLTVVVILVASVIASAVGVFLTVRFFEKRRRLRGDAAIEVGKSMNKKNARHKRRFSQTEYDTLPLSDNVRKRRFSTGHDLSDKWGNLMDATLPDDYVYQTPDDDGNQTPDVIIEYDSDENKLTKVVINQTEDKPMASHVPKVILNDISDEAPSVVEDMEDDFDGIPFEICHPDDLRDICNVADVPGNINLYSAPILKNRGTEETQHEK
ncbi:MAG: hypothetical protein EOP45_22000, partial [Sphingobacteriaceae bacterium]